MKNGNEHIPAQYDKTTVILHWLSALLVVVLFASALIWDDLPRGTPLRKGLQSFHISLGIFLLGVFVTRVFWRLTRGRHLPAASKGLQQLAAATTHRVLYVLIGVQIALGFLFRWAQGEPFNFFGLFSIPSLMTPDRARAHTLGEIHETIAWIIIALAGIHAIAALLHHFIMKDGVLKRMGFSKR